MGREPGRQGPPNDPNRDGCGPAILLLCGKWFAILAAIAWLTFALTGFRQ